MQPTGGGGPEYLGSAAYAVRMEDRNSAPGLTSSAMAYSSSSLVQLILLPLFNKPFQVGPPRKTIGHVLSPFLVKDVHVVSIYGDRTSSRPMDVS